MVYTRAPYARRAAESVRKKTAGGREIAADVQNQSLWYIHIVYAGELTLYAPALLSCAQ